MDTKGKNILNRVWAKMRKHRLEPDIPRQFKPPPPPDPPIGVSEPQDNIRRGQWDYRPAKGRYRNPIIKQAPSTDPRFNHKLRRA